MFTSCFPHFTSWGKTSPYLGEKATIAVHHASQDEIRRAHRGLVDVFHPDKLRKYGLGEEEQQLATAVTQELIAARDELRDEDRRRQLDELWTRSGGLQLTGPLRLVLLRPVLGGRNTTSGASGKRRAGRTRNACRARWATTSAGGGATAAPSSSATWPWASLLAVRISSAPVSSATTCVRSGTAGTARSATRTRCTSALLMDTVLGRMRACAAQLCLPTPFEPGS